MIKRFLGLVASIGLLASLAMPVHAADLSLDGNLRLNCGTVTATGNGTAGAATLANKCGVVTTEALTGPTASEYTLTLTNSVIAAADIVLFSVANGTNTTGLMAAERVTPAAGSAVFVVRQMSTASANGTLTIRYFVIKP
jgi:hypothetical protein